MIFRQLLDYESNTFTYILGDHTSKNAAIIDPVLENLERDLKILNELDLKLKFILDTHCHADHITAGMALQRRTAAKYLAGQNSHISVVDNFLLQGDILELGEIEIHVFETPGHTKGCCSFFVPQMSMVMTGDTLLIRGCGRTDFQEGSPKKLYKSVHEKIYSLPDDTKIYPGHDYKGMSVSAVLEEKSWNPRLNTKITEDKFVEIMNGLHLSPPKKLDLAVPRNLKGGDC